MTRVIKGGCELMISDSAVTEYVRKGYSVIDKKGNIVPVNKPLTYDEAMKQITTLEARCKGLVDALNKANDQIKVLRKKTKSAEE